MPIALGWFVGVITLTFVIAYFGHRRDSPVAFFTVIVLVLSAVGGMYSILL
jgi:hypothetical protein